MKHPKHYAEVLDHAHGFLGADLDALHRLLEFRLLHDAAFWEEWKDHYLGTLCEDHQIQHDPDYDPNDHDDELPPF